jgi:opacity protein-like surface antigen
MKKVLTVAVIAMMLLSLAAGAAVAKEKFKGSKFKGTVQQLPYQGYIGDWVIDGKIVQVTPGTKLDFEGGPAQVGSFVEVKGTPFEGGFIATKIETKRSRR